MERDDLAQYLDSLEREDCYRIERVLKESPHEVTQLVRFIGANGTAGQPLIRKFIQRESGLGSAYTRLFEAQQAGQRFKHIPDIHECYERDGVLVVVMEFIQGETLKDYVYRCDPSLNLARSVFPRLCDAVSELHEEFDPPIIHRDLKPSNVILSDAGLVVIDFGIAREYHADANADTTRFGTRAFAPPEQFGFGQTTVRSDVYALGMLLYFCLTEKIPDATLSENDLVDPVIPPELGAVIQQATAFDPAERFASAAALKTAFFHAVERATGSASVTAMNAAAATFPGMVGGYSTAPVPAAEQPVRTSTPGRVRNGIIIALLVFLLIGCVSSFIHPATSVADNPTWYNAFSYLVFMPALLLGTALVLADKTQLKQRFPRLRGVKTWHWIVMYLAFLGALFILLGIVSMLR